MNEVLFLLLGPLDFDLEQMCFKEVVNALFVQFEVQTFFFSWLSNFFV